MRPLNVIATFLIIFGTIKFFTLALDMGITIFKDDNEKKQEQYDDIAQRAYSNGRLWGRVTASMYEDDYGKPGTLSEARNASLEVLKSREYDYYCWGAEDCGDLPTEEEILRVFGKVDWGSDSMPQNAFTSGFSDAFVEYFY